MLIIAAIIDVESRVVPDATNLIVTASRLNTLITIYSAN